MNDVQNTLKNMVVMGITDQKELSETMIDDMVKQVSGLPMFLSLSFDDIEEVKATIKSEFSIKLDKGVLIEEKHHERWFLARKADLSMSYWERYKKYLINDKHFSISVVNSMDDILDTLTDLLGDPERNVKYNRRGLIIGDVQSGKTANYTGLICKAVDSGYKVVVLLTGTIEKLRQQTQIRIDEGFVGRDSDALIKNREDKVVIGVGKYDSSISPVCLTSRSDDFKQNNAANLNFDLRNINGSVIFVVKKNSAVLKRLNKWFRTFNQNRDNPIDNSILLIDDEADNASVNTKDSDDTPTAINGQIREMLKSFTKSSYVGFTATPFANIFIDPDTQDDMLAEDLFPKDYIYSLNAPSNYIGARDIFSADGDNKYMLVTINEDTTNPESIATILPVKHKSSIWVSHLPEDMKDAIAAFILSNVIQDIDLSRKREKTHRSMLINVSRFTAVQEQISRLVNNYLKEVQGACKIYAGLPTDKALADDHIARLERVYTDHYGNIGIPWEAVQQSLYKSSAPITVYTINQRGEKNLDYDLYPGGLRMIAVGGMSLSRGLTLEGLVVSYFYRNSTMYDTLMQMGRWFGYRKGYEELCRIWMSDESVEWYRHISDATDELRDEVKRYEDSEMTPQDFGLRVRSDITTLLVTARNKMRSAERRSCVISMSGEVIETPDILADPSKNDININAVKELIDEINMEGIHIISEGNRYGYKNIPVINVLELLDKLEISPRNEAFNATAIADFIRSYHGDELKKWDIVFVSGESVDETNLLGKGYEYHHPTRIFSIENNGKILRMSGPRRRLMGPNDGRFGISRADEELARQHAKKRAILKAEMRGKPIPQVISLSQKDYFIPGIIRNPLLAIYVVGLGDLAKDKTVDNIALANKYRDVCYMGFGIGIPALSDQETKYATYILNKVALKNMYEGEWEDEEENGD